jgi:hypothetical protein
MVAMEFSNTRAIELQRQSTTDGALAEVSVVFAHTLCKCLSAIGVNVTPTIALLLG